MSPPCTGGATRGRAAVQAVGLAAILAAAATAHVGADAARWFGVRGPRCLAGACLDPIGCPACGLVRSVASAVQGDLAAACRFHPGGALCAAALFAGFVAAASRAGSRRPLPWSQPLATVARRAFVAAIVLGWLVRIALHATPLIHAP